MEKRKSMSLKKVEIGLNQSKMVTKTYEGQQQMNGKTDFIVMNDQRKRTLSQS